MLGNEHSAQVAAIVRRGRAGKQVNFSVSQLIVLSGKDKVFPLNSAVTGS